MFRKTLIVATLFAASILGQASAQITLYDGAAGDDFFGSAPGGFVFNDFAGQVTDTGASLIFDIATDIDGTNGLFGGLGRDVLSVPDIDAATALFRIVYRPLEDNAAGSFNFILSDIDSPTEAQDFQFGIATAAGTPLGNGFFEQNLAITPGSEQFSQAAFGFPGGIGDGIANYGLRQWQIQSGFGSTDRLNIEVQSVSIVEAIPEPNSLIALMGLGVVGLVKRRR